MATKRTAAVDEPVASNYTVLARRYRPGTFVECIGQEHVADALRSAIEANRVAHAYLFTGARGVGKTSMARILAKSLNCVTGPTILPCGKCDLCQAIAAGEDVDVIEIDGASNNGVEQVRELRQGVNFRPSRSRFKIYIIDEVHMLSNAAFNALLKTLEEPPAHVKFIFATTEVQKIPITVLSRCQRFDFAGIEAARIFTHLKAIVAKEGLSAEDDALELIARRAGGSMRDSQSLLDQLLAFGGENLTADIVHRVLGTAGDERIFTLAEAALSGDATTCLNLVENAAGAGVQLGEWVEQMLDFFRDLMVLGVNPQAELVGMPNRLRPQMVDMAKKLPPERLIERMDLLASCRSRMKSSTYGRTLLEMTLVRICLLDRFFAVSEALATGPAAIVDDAKKNARPAVSGAPSIPIEHRPVNRLEPHFQKTETAPSNAGEDEEAAPRPILELGADTVREFWKALHAELDDPLLCGMLDKSADVSFQPPNALVVRFAHALSVAKNHCEEANRLAKLEICCTQLAGRKVAVRFESLAPVDAPTAVPRSSQPRLKQIANNLPLVQAVQSLLDAKIIAVDAMMPAVVKAATAEPAISAAALETERELEREPEEDLE